MAFEKKTRQDLIDLLISFNCSPKSLVTFEVLLDEIDIGILGFGSQKFFKLNAYNDFHGDVPLFQEESFKNAIAEVCINQEIKPFFNGDKFIYLRGFKECNHSIAICFDERTKAVNFINELNLIIKKIEFILKEEAYLNSLKPIQENNNKKGK